MGVESTTEGRINRKHWTVTGRETRKQASRKEQKAVDQTSNCLYSYLFRTDT